MKQSRESETVHVQHSHCNVETPETLISFLSLCSIEEDEGSTSTEDETDDERPESGKSKTLEGISLMIECVRDLVDVSVGLEDVCVEALGTPANE